MLSRIYAEVFLWYPALPTLWPPVPPTMSAIMSDEITSLICKAGWLRCRAWKQMSTTLGAGVKWGQGLEIKVPCCFLGQWLKLRVKSSFRLQPVQSGMISSPLSRAACGFNAAASAPAKEYSAEYNAPLSLYRLSDGIASLHSTAALKSMRKIIQYHIIDIYMMPGLYYLKEKHCVLALWIEFLIVLKLKRTQTWRACRLMRSWDLLRFHLR